MPTDDSSRATAPRFDLYATVHKALRTAMTDALLRLGRTDADDPADLAGAADTARRLLELCRAHVAHENTWVHPAIEAAAPGGSSVIAADHVEHLVVIDDLLARVAALADVEPACRAAEVHALYHRLSLFVAHNFEHMHVEETAHNGLLWAHYTDEELLALHDQLVASIPPEETMVVMRWMLPAVSPAERQAILADIRAKAPPPVFDAVLGMLRPLLAASDWAKLERGLALGATAPAAKAAEALAA